jgi:hypothetical protein
MNDGVMVIKRTVPLDLPPDVAEAFAADMRAFLVEKSARRRDELAARQLRALRKHVPGRLSPADVKAMFFQLDGKILISRVPRA